jgi:hypothetical protein
MSRSDASLVVKLLDPDGSGPLVAGFTASGYQLDINSRIGGTLQIVGQSNYPVVLTSLRDDTVGASVDPLGRTVKDTANDGETSGAAGDWRGLAFYPYSNDRNVAIVQDADILLLDEPFAAIDAAGAESLVGLLDGWRRRGCTILAAMHDLALVRRHFPLAILLARRVIAAGPTAQALAPDKLDEARRALDEGFTDALCTHHDHGVLQP